jgi:hypothetical protein
MLVQDTLRYTHNKEVALNILKYFAIISSFIIWICFPSLVMANDFELTARYGGTIYSPNAKLETPSRNGSMGGSHLVAIDGSGPEMFWRLRPLVSYEYHWSGDGSMIYISTQSDIISLGLLRSFSLGYARTSIALAATHFYDAYKVNVDGDDRIDHKANVWGVSVGIDFRFKFFDHLDAVIGYKYLGRQKPKFDSETVDGTPYSVEGRGGDHSIFAGVSIILGGV